MPPAVSRAASYWAAMHGKAWRPKNFKGISPDRGGFQCQWQAISCATDTGNSYGRRQRGAKIPSWRTCPMPPSVSMQLPGHARRRQGDFPRIRGILHQLQATLARCLCGNPHGRRHPVTYFLPDRGAEQEFHRVVLVVRS